MIILARVQKDLKEALKAKNSLVLATLRLLLAEIRNQEIALRGGESEDLKEEQVKKIISREIKKRKQAIELYHRGHRPKLAEQEEREIKILAKYLS